MAHESGGSVAERLGFSADDRVAVVHVDDIGMSHAANIGAFEAMQNGPATCGSVMVPCPWFAEAAALARDTKDVDLGVHLTLTAEYESYRWGPLLGADVPSLSLADGTLPRTMLEVASGDPAEIERELRAQIDRALEAGIDVTHLDTHMGTTFLPAIFPIYAQLAIDYRLPIFIPRPDPALVEARGLQDAVAPMLEVSARYEAAGGPIFDHVDPYSLDFAEGEGVEWNRNRIAGLKPGVNWLLCHAALDGDELRAITPDSAHHRDFERQYYGGPPGREALDAAGIKTIGMRPLRDLMRSS
jgi:predicted glycoside hydrolase/deacetylase ChbG (UPF0249 family)